MNKGRTWTIVEQLIGSEDWAKKVGTLAGCATTSPLRLREVFESDTRDVLVFAPNRVIVVQPKSSGKLGLIAGLRAALGNPSGLGTVRAIAKSDVVGFSIQRGVTGVLDDGAGLMTAVVDVREGVPGGAIRFVVDTGVIGIGDIEQNVNRWLGRGA
ncbi:hypothetical protein ACIBXA_31985 [Micromonospora echinaurantiaca]|uniref:hypothetical protein n=1 Tax=Micromonospora echinaurantiaca TaxID=47857 RepID=UPI0037933B33